MSSYTPPEEDKTEGSETTDNRDIKSERTIETVDGLSRRDKVLAVVAMAVAGGVVAGLAYGQLAPNSEFADVVAGWLRAIGIDLSTVPSGLVRRVAESG